MSFTGFIGTVCMFPLRAIIATCVRLRIHPNVLTAVGVLINVAAATALAVGRFRLAGFIMIVANIFDFIDGKVAHRLQLQSEFGAFWDSTLDRFSDLALFTGLIWLYAGLGRNGYVLIATLALIFSINEIIISGMAKFSPRAPSKSTICWPVRRALSIREVASR